MTKWKAWMVLAVAVPLMAGCSKPQAVTDLRASITALVQAGNDAAIAQDKYHALVVEARSRFTAAKGQMPVRDMLTCREALDKAGDVDLLWRDTDGIANGLTPVAEEPLTRLGVVKNHAEFGKWEATFIPLQQSLDGEQLPDDDERTQARNQVRHDLIKQAMEAAAPALKKAEAAL
jgi:hypothetical protein